MKQSKGKLLRYLKDDKSNKSFLVEGLWGTGKTFFVKKFFEEDYKLKRKTVFVSCFGISSIEELGEQIISQLSTSFFEKGKDIVFSGLAKILRRKISFTWADPNGNQIGVSIDPPQNPKSQKKIITNKDFILILDDIERSTINFNDFFGYINNLSSEESNSIKTICICNTDCQNVKQPVIEKIDEIISQQNKTNDVHENSHLLEVWKEYLKNESYWTSSFNSLKNKVFCEWINLNQIEGREKMNFLFETEDFLLSIFADKSKSDLKNLNEALKTFVPEISWKMQSNVRNLEAYITKIKPFLNEIMINDFCTELIVKIIRKSEIPSDGEKRNRYYSDLNTEIVNQFILDHLLDSLIGNYKNYGKFNSFCIKSLKETHKILSDEKNNKTLRWLNSNTLISVSKIEFEDFFKNLTTEEFSSNYVSIWLGIFRKIKSYLMYETISTNDFDEIANVWEEKIINYHIKNSLYLDEESFLSVSAWNVFQNSKNNGEHFTNWLKKICKKINESDKMKAQNNYVSDDIASLEKILKILNSSKKDIEESISIGKNENLFSEFHYSIQGNIRANTLIINDLKEFLSLCKKNIEEKYPLQDGHRFDQQKEARHFLLVFLQKLPLNT